MTHTVSARHPPSIGLASSCVDVRHHELAALVAGVPHNWPRGVGARADTPCECLLLRPAIGRARADADQVAAVGCSVAGVPLRAG
eukprot:4877090-Alexandrium_andersonii.AAC.1